MVASCFRRRLPALVLASAVVVVTSGARPHAAYAEGTKRAAVDPKKLAEAKQHFMRGVDHVDRGEWDAALSEFLRSRELVPNAKNTYNAAVCLRKVGRFDEAVDMYESFLRDYPTAEDRKVAESELAQLRTSVGALDVRGGVPGATVTVDGRDQGAMPLEKPVRVGAGSHTVRVVRDGYLPFEKRVDVVGMQTATVDVRMAVLTAGGRLHVDEKTGRTIDVVVDGKVVGKTPWDGVLPPGEHTVLLRGEDSLGTQPAAVKVVLDEARTIDLLAEPLGASVKLHASPENADMLVDGVNVGRKEWEGRLRPGAHVVEARADGYLPQTRKVALESLGEGTVDLDLERDPATMGGTASLGIEVDVGAALGVRWGGDLESACTGPCASSFPFGGHAAIRGTYQTRSRFGVGLDVGYLTLSHKLDSRAATVAPIGLPENAGAVRDELSLRGLTAGASASYRGGDAWRVTVRLGAGAFLASAKDTRAGTFRNAGGPYDVSLTKTSGATYLYAAPEVRFGRRLGEHLELSVGVEAMILAALSTPRWQDDGQVSAGADGIGTFGTQSMTGSFMVLVVPGLGARYDF